MREFYGLNGFLTARDSAVASRVVVKGMDNFQDTVEIYPNGDKNGKILVKITHYSSKLQLYEFHVLM